MFLVGRKREVERNPEKFLGYYRRLKPEIKTVDEEKILAEGEPFFLNGKYKDRAVIAVLKPGTFWVKKSKILRIVGEPVDPQEIEELHFVLHSRREGDIYGRWFSCYCPEGEFGFIHFNSLEEIDYEQYERELYGFRGQKSSD